MKKKAKEALAVFATGKRKRAVARASLKPGKGLIKVNGIPLPLVSDDIARLRMQEPLLIAGEPAAGLDIAVTVHGGGPMGQAEAARMAIARCLVQQIGAELKKQFMEYDRNLLIYDSRRTETHKPPHSSWGARRYKQRSKR